MELKDLQEMWAKDSKIDQTKLGEEISRTFTLHSHWSDIFDSIKKETLSAEKNYLKIRKIMNRYYSGEMGKEELQHYKLEQFQGKKPSKTMLDDLLEMDSILMPYKERVEELHIMREKVEDICVMIRYRQRTIQNLIDYEKFCAGA